MSNSNALYNIIFLNERKKEKEIGTKEENDRVK